MLRISKKFIALLLAVWLPLFSGYALADSIIMQSVRMHGDCRFAHQATHSSQQDSASQQYMHHAQMNGNENQTTVSPDNKGSGCNNSGICQFSCNGYFVATNVNMAAVEPSTQSFMPFLTQFQSVTIAPLDPPPLARV